MGKKIHENDVFFSHAVFLNPLRMSAVQPLNNSVAGIVITTPVYLFF